VLASSHQFPIIATTVRSPWKLWNNGLHHADNVLVLLTLWVSTPLFMVIKSLVIQIAFSPSLRM
jgi:hypothetical protein